MVVVQTEDEEDRDRTHAESIQDNTTGKIVGTTKTVPTTDLIDMLDEVVEAVNKIGVEAEALDVIITRTMEVEIIISRAIIIITTNHRTNSKAIIMNRTGHN